MSMTPMQEWREHQDRRRLKRLKKSLLAIEDPFSNIEEVRNLNEEIIPLERRLRILDSIYLVKEAARLDIDIPEKDNWWKDSGSEIWQGRVLTDIGQEGLRKLIREARFRIIKKWAELLIPILSLLIAILALTRK